MSASLPTKPEVILVSTLTCPVCGLTSEEKMALDSCRFYYDCSECATTLRPLAGDCCVFCSYGSVRCPSKQMETYA